MKCPVCNQDLVMSDRQGIEIDYCGKCRGVWLDRGELDKIIERSVREAPQAAAPAAPQAQPYRDERPYPRRDHDDDRYKHKHYKQKSWLSELFD